MHVNKEEVNGDLFMLDTTEGLTSSDHLQHKKKQFIWRSFLLLRRIWNPNTIRKLERTEEVYLFFHPPHQPIRGEVKRVSKHIYFFPGPTLHFFFNLRPAEVGGKGYNTTLKYNKKIK